MRIIYTSHVLAIMHKQILLHAIYFAVINLLYFQLQLSSSDESSDEQ